MESLPHRLRLTTLSPRLVTVPPRRFLEVAVAPEVDPGLVNLSADDVEAIWGSVLDLYDTGLHPAIAMCIRRHGEVILDRAVGHQRGNAPSDLPEAEKVPATPKTLFNLFSASKALTAMLVHLLDDRGQLHLDDAVVEYIPEFGLHHKRWITIRHVLSHRAGMPVIPGDRVDLDLLGSPDEIIRLLCEAKPSSRPGRRLAYHALTGGFILGEIVRRVTGKDIRQFHKEQILDPLGFEHLTYGVTPELVPRVALHAFTGFPALYPYGELLRRSLGVTIEQAAELSNDPRFLTALIPSGNVICTANEASRYFQLLLNEGSLDGKRIFSPRTVRRAVSEQSYLEVDATLLLPVRYGMGFMLGGDYLSFYGPDTPRAFGHLGFTNLLVWADPERDIAVSLLTTGKPFITPRLLRWFQVMYTVAKRIPKVRRIGS